MILTVTLNPALDITYTVDSLVPGATHRVTDVGLGAGGKGLNVARVLNAIGVPVLATGLLGGANGERIASLLAGEGVRSSFLPLEGETRRTVVVTDGHDATGFWEPGPAVTATEWAALLTSYRNWLTAAEVVVLAGSLPPGLADDSYVTLVSIAREAGVVTLLDADGPALVAGLLAEPTVVKPNAVELAAATGHEVVTLADAQGAARALRAGRPTAVVASLGAAGLVASTVEGDWRARPARPVDGNPTGAGDACVAALAAGLRERREWPDVLADAAACGAAAVCEARAGVVDPDRVRTLRTSVVVEEI